MKRSVSETPAVQRRGTAVLRAGLPQLGAPCTESPCPALPLGTPRGDEGKRGGIRPPRAAQGMPGVISPAPRPLLTRVQPQLVAGQRL